MQQLQHHPISSNICAIPNLHAHSNMYSSMHAAIDTKHCICIWQLGYNNYASSNTYITSHYQALHIQRHTSNMHAPNISFYGNRHADITYSIQPIHMQPHICNKTHAMLHIKQCTDTTCIRNMCNIQCHITSNVHRTSCLWQCTFNTMNNAIHV